MGLNSQEAEGSAPIAPLNCSSLEGANKPRPPTAIKPNFENLPAELKLQPNWVLWRYLPPKSGSTNWRKVPFQPNGMPASTTNPSTWSTFQECRDTYHRGGFDGVGFVFDGRPDECGLVLAGVDFDKVISPVGEIGSLAAARVKNLGSYFEASVSGSGLHVILKGRPLQAGVSHAGTEAYTHGRFFTMTGRTGRTARPIVSAPDALQALVEELRAHSRDPSEVSPAFPLLEPIVGVTDLEAGIETSQWCDALTPDDKDALIDYALGIVATNTPLLELEANGGNNSEYYKLTTAIARSGAAHAEDIFVKHASRAKDADSEDALRQHFARCAQRRLLGAAITVGTLLHHAERNGANFSSWKQPNSIIVPTPHYHGGNSGLHPVSPQSFADPFAEFVGPPFPPDILPTTIEQFVSAQNRAMGADAAALAMAALTTAAGAVHAETCVRVGDGWWEKPILWTALVGQPSTMKSPIIDKATKPLVHIDHQRDQLWRRQDAAWQQQNKGSKNPAPRPPKPVRSVIHDATPEKTAEILSREPRGALMVHDELAGWLGGFERYNSGAPVRAFYLSSWNGSIFIKDRVGQGARDPYAEIRVENLALGLVGGIQPDRLSAIRDLTSDGLLQRILPVLMQPAERGDQGYPVTAAENAYDQLIQMVHSAQPWRYQFDTNALAVRDRLLDYLHNLEQLDGLSAPLIGAIGKLKGYYGRIALALQVAGEHDAMLRGVGLGTGATIPLSVAEAAEKIIREFLLPHIFGFYDVVVNGGQERDTLRTVASFILASDKDRLRACDLTAGVRKLRGDKQHRISEWAGRFCAMGWLRAEDEKAAVPKAWLVAPGLREHFAKRRDQARAARAAAHEILKAGGSRRAA